MIVTYQPIYTHATPPPIYKYILFRPIRIRVGCRYRRRRKSLVRNNFIDILFYLFTLKIIQQHYIKYISNNNGRKKNVVTRQTRCKYLLQWLALLSEFGLHRKNLYYNICAIVKMVPFINYYYCECIYSCDVVNGMDVGTQRKVFGRLPAGTYNGKRKIRMMMMLPMQTVVYQNNEH